MPEVHDGTVSLRHSFEEVWNWLQKHGETQLATDKGTQFSAVASTTRDGREVVRFIRGSQESARAYACCWGHYYNCNQTRIGMYSSALDEAITRTPDAIGTIEAIAAKHKGRGELGGLVSGFLTGRLGEEIRKEGGQLPREMDEWRELGMPQDGINVDRSD